MYPTILPCGVCWFSPVGGMGPDVTEANAQEGIQTWLSTLDSGPNAEVQGSTTTWCRRDHRLKFTHVVGYTPSAKQTQQLWEVTTTEMTLSIDKGHNFNGVSAAGI